VNSKEFKAFKAGLNLYLNASLKPFVEEIETSSKYLLSRSYNRRIVNGHQILPKLAFFLDAGVSQEFRNRLEPLVPTIKAMFSRYIVGHGHPSKEDITGMISDTQMDQDNRDPAYRAKRLVKMISGMQILPMTDRTFNIIIQERITDAASFGRQYDVCHYKYLVHITGSETRPGRPAR